MVVSGVGTWLRVYVDKLVSGKGERKEDVPILENCGIC